MNYIKQLCFLMGSAAAFGSAHADQQILDDLIVDGSICVGQDCVNGESFGFDTIRLKENNLRIRFQDTSNSASFPSNDWQLTANDSSNGGANKFSIDDIDGGRTPFTIEASAPTDSLYVEDGGRIGFGTNTPVVTLHAVEGNTPTLRLEQDGSSGFTPQTWDMASNEANFFIRDATNGSTLPFRIEPSAGTNSLYIDSTNDIGIGTNAPATSLHVRRTSGDAVLRVENASATNGDHAELQLNSDAQAWSFRSNTNNGTLTVINGTSGLTPFVLSPVAVSNLLQVGFNSAGAQDANNINITGSLTASGTITPDYVFEDSYDLISIEDHAKFMWENNHLPHVEKAKVDANGTPYFDMVSRSQDLLEELEVAHIYIQQLNEQVKQLKTEKQAALSSLEQRIANLEKTK